MRFFVIQRILGVLFTIFSLTLLPPALVAWISKDGLTTLFLEAFGILLFLGLLLWLPVFTVRRELRLKDGFIVVVLFWVTLGLAGALPLSLAESLHMSVTDAVFESISGLTTTGATVLTQIDDLPLSILYYRQQLQWLGGMGIIVLAVAILPMLGIGGMQLYRAETPGPMKDTKLTPRITETAKALWYIYLGLTIACALGYWAAGMEVFDAVAHSFSTIAIGGFSTHDASIGYFHSTLIESVAIVFMLLAGINFSLHFVAWRGMTFKPYLHDTEFKTYIGILIFVAFVTTLSLYLTQTFDKLGSGISHGIFHAVSIGTTAGFTTTQYYQWPIFLPVLLLFTSFIGGCAGSTGGGLKVIRVVLLFKQGMREINRLIHPNAVIPIKLGNNTVSYTVMDAIWGFFAAYVAIFTLMLLALMATGMDQITAFSAMAACMNNLGPGLGEVAQNYASINDFAKGVLSMAMLLGRLEIFTLLVIISPAFWRR